MTFRCLIEYFFVENTDTRDAPFVDLHNRRIAILMTD
jgi:hypothetical protein